MRRSREGKEKSIRERLWGCKEEITKNKENTRIVEKS